MFETVFYIINKNTREMGSHISAWEIKQRAQSELRSHDNTLLHYLMTIT